MATFEHKETCLFTNDNSTACVGNFRAYYQYSSKVLDLTYYVSKGVALKFPREGKSSYTPQHLAKCARKCLQLKEENLTPLWVLSEEADKFILPEVPGITFSKCVLEDVISEPIDHAEKPYILLELIGKKQNLAGAFGEFKFDIKDMYRAAIPSTEELVVIAKHLFDEKLLQNQAAVRIEHSNILQKEHNSITIKGWDTLRKRQLGAQNNKVFIATQFSWTVNGITSDKAIEAIQRACEACKYEADTVDRKNHTDYITNQIMNEIRKANFVVAEFTENNRGVYFEAGFARGLGKKVFHVIHEDYIKGVNSKNKRMHFDTEQIYNLRWKDLSTLEKNLAQWIENTVGIYGEPRIES